jgi:hypothetical protein
MDPRIFPVALRRPIGGILENILTPLLHPIKNSVIGKKGSFTEESDGETAGVLILLAATVSVVKFSVAYRWRRILIK